MLSINEYYEHEKILDEEMEQLWDYPQLDGITNYEKYSAVCPKILWILKETNRWDKNNSPKVFNLRKYFTDVSGYSRWATTFGNIMRVSYALINGLFEFKNIPVLDTKECLIDGCVVLDEIAIININKDGGSSVSYPSELNMEYSRNGVKEFIFKQIELIDPQIIINCNSIHKFFSDLSGGGEINKINGEYFVTNGKRIIIDTGHPAMKHNESYCNNILRIIKENYCSIKSSV